MSKIVDQHKHELDNLLQEKNSEDGLTENPNNIITNLSSHTLTEEEFEALRYGLKFGLATLPCESNILAYTEDIWEQISKSKICNVGKYNEARIKNSLRCLAFNIINIDEKRIFKDQKKIKLLKSLQKTITVLKPDKGNGIVLMDKSDYIHAVGNIFGDSNKFKLITDDPTITRMKSLQNYLRKIRNRGELTKDEFNLCRPKNEKPAKVHGLPKIHKSFDRIPKFRPIIDTTGSTHYFEGKFLASLLKPLTVNEFSVKDSFDAATRINNIPKDLLESNHKFISFDVESLFTNVPISKTINIILKRIYDDKLISTNLRKITLKNLILDSCTKTAFTFNNKLYEPKDGVSMGSSLGPALANIIMAELEEIIIQQLIENGVIKFYYRYVDDTLMVIEDKYIDFVHKELNSFDKNLKFIVDLFDKETPHFLDLELSPDRLSIFSKDTNTGLYVNFNSYIPWSYCVSWIRSLVSRAHAICKPDKLKLEINLIKKFASWNDFPKTIASAIINRSLNNDDKTDQANESDPNMDTDVRTIYFRMPYFGDKGVSLIKACINKIRANCIENRKIVFKILYDVARTEVFCNNKDKTSFLCQSNVVYIFVCPGFNSSYVGKTERTLSERTTGHA